MAKNKKAASSSSSFKKKKAAPATSKKPVRNSADGIDSKKAEVISEKINKMNKRFENLISECKVALDYISEK